MAFYPPQLQFEITVQLEKRSYLTENGTGVWKRVSELKIGAHDRIALSDSHVVKCQCFVTTENFKNVTLQVKAEYVADFHANSFVKSEKLVHRYLLIPDMNLLPRQPPFADIYYHQWKPFVDSVSNISEWMAIEKRYFDFSGFSCNKIGVAYTAFRRQPNPCTSRHGRLT